MVTNFNTINKTFIKVLYFMSNLIRFQKLAMKEISVLTYFSDVFAIDVAMFPYRCRHQQIR